MSAATSVQHQHPNLPGVETFYISQDEWRDEDYRGLDATDPGWYWVTVDYLGTYQCDPYGPHDSEAAALVAACADLNECEFWGDGVVRSVDV